MAQVLNELNKLRLECLNEDWVQGIYYSEFLEFGDIPPEYESILESLEICSLFHGIMTSVIDWLNDESDSPEEKSWQTLSQHIQHQKLLAVIAYYIDHGSKNVQTKEYRSNALLASRLYYKLLSVPGYKAYHIYHSQLFANSLGCLSFPKAMCENENNYYNTKELARDVNFFIKELRYFVLDLMSIIRTLQLTPNDMNFEDILSNLVDVTGGAIVNKLNIDRIELTKICKTVYEMIDILVCECNGEPNPVAIRLLFKVLLPKLVASSIDTRNANNLVRASYVTYSGLTLHKYGKAALSSYNVLLQHLCYTLEGLERAEVRTARVSLVVGLMSLLPHKSYGNIIKWLLKLSTTSKVVHRQIALEMLSNLLSNDPEEIRVNEELTEAQNTESTNSTNSEQTTQQEIQPNLAIISDTDLIDASKDHQEQSAAENMIITDETSQDSQDSSIQNNIEQDMTEEDVASLLRQRKHRVPHGLILRAVYERVHDASSTVRARALAILADCLTSQHPALQQALKELSGAEGEGEGEGEGVGGVVSEAAARGACDERAAVRRAAAPLVRLLLRAAREPRRKDLAILVGLCCDASILVRSAAISAVGELVTQRPCEAVIDAFLSGPMHQLSDPETKIQDSVVTFIQQILIDRLQKYTAVGDGCDDPLPWMFLDGVVRHNKRRHLQKACSLLSKRSNCINHRLVDILSTHLGVDCDARDLQCLVLLTSLSKDVEYNDVAFVFEYYYKVSDNLEGRERDARLTALTLELCGQWARWAAGPERRALRDHLVRTLATSRLDCRPAYVQLAAQLDPDDLTWANELMQISERRALENGEVDEWIRAADLSLFAPAPPSPALLQLFLNALEGLPSEWQEARSGAVVAGAGRLCVRSRHAAVAAAPRLAALLRPPAAAPPAPLAARHNALLALTDICIRYTCIVEPLLELVCGCLAAGEGGFGGGGGGGAAGAEATLRRAAARALTRLLLAGFLRLRTPLYYKYCALLADEDHEVREPAEYYVTCCLATDAIYHHFVDCVLYYNKEDTENLSFDSRQLIYDVMLQRMSIVQKLNIQCRLARQVLEHAADITDEGDGEIPAALNAALLDTITLLCGPRMKLPKKPQTTGDAADIDDLQERVTTNIVSHKMKRTVAEVVVPAVLRLHARLRARGGQLAAYLVRIATDLLADYRAEIEELIENDEEMVVRVQQFQETIGLEPTFGNARNLVTSSAPPEPETPRTVRRRPATRPLPRSPVRKRALRI